MYYEDEDDAERESRLLLEELGIPMPLHLQRSSKPQPSAASPLPPAPPAPPPATISSSSAPSKPERRPNARPTPPPLSRRRRSPSPLPSRESSRRRFDEPTPEEEAIHREFLQRQTGSSSSRRRSGESSKDGEKDREKRKAVEREVEFLRRRPSSFAPEEPKKPTALEIPIGLHRHLLVTPTYGKDVVIDICNLVINGLPYDAQDRDLLEYFRVYGRVTSVKVMLDTATRKSRGFGFANFENPADAEAALDDANRGRKLMGHRLSVKFHRPGANSIVTKAALDARHAPPNLREQPLQRPRSRSRTPPPPWSPPRKKVSSGAGRIVTSAKGANGTWRMNEEKDKNRAPPPPPPSSRGKSLPAALGLPWLQDVDAELLGVLAGFLEAMEKPERDALIAQLTDYSPDERATFVSLLPQLRQQQKQHETETTTSSGGSGPRGADSASSSSKTSKQATPPPPTPPKLGLGLRSDWS